MPIAEIARARKCGHTHFHIVYEYPVPLNRILQMCFLKPEADKLLEIKRAEAIAAIKHWLFREPAYHIALMSEELAQKLAEKFIREFADDTSRFFTNGRWFDPQEPKHWQPLTQSVFDGGVIIESGKVNKTCHVCLWFEDED